MTCEQFVLFEMFDLWRILPVTHLIYFQFYLSDRDAFDP